VGVGDTPVVDQDLRLARATGPHGPLPDRDDQADHAGDHQDQADRPHVHPLDVEVGREPKDRAHRDQEDAACEGHRARPPLGNPAEEIDGQQDQDDDDENSYDGHVVLL
jgi:hypothetical protein